MIAHKTQTAQVTRVAHIACAVKKPLFVVALVASLCVGACAFTGCSMGTTCETMTLYYQTLDDTEQVPVYFVEPSHQIPYIDLDTWKHAASRVVNEGMGDYPEDSGYALEISTHGNKAVLTRENGATLTLDFAKDAMTFSDFDRFTGQSYNLTPLDVAHTSGYNGYNNNGKPAYLTRNEDLSFWRDGGEVTIDLAAYDIDLVHSGSGYYVPAQTMFDLLLTSNYVNFLYNTEALFIVDFETACEEVAGESPEGLMAQYYRANVGTMSTDLVQFNYDEICMTLDYYYGLKEEKGIDSFDEYFKQVYVGSMTAKEALCSGDARTMDEALAAISFWIIDDVHTKYVAPSVYTGYDPGIKDETWNGVSRDLINGSTSDYKAARSAAYPNGCPSYEEVGDTAYVTFDAFENASQDYYATGPVADAKDTMGIIIYAHSQIKREGSPIKNVVVDLSCNGGGSEDTVCFTCAWMLGQAGLSLKDSLSGATSTTNYSCDVNLDRVFDERDTIADLNVYCLISEGSFSCANLTPTVLADSCKVTLLGQTSGGGACVVQPMTTATGSFYRFSGYKTVCSYKNGSYYCADRGVEPDFTLSKKESFYDRASLTEYIDSLK